MIWLSCIFIVLAGISKGFLDYYSDVGIKGKEWVNKWKNVNEAWGKKDLKRHHWWYFGLYSPSMHLENFPFSSTVLVFLTDKWHLAQFFMLRFFYLAIAVLFTQNILIITLLSFVIFPIILGIPFEIVYNIKKLRNEIRKMVR